TRASAAASAAGPPGAASAPLAAAPGEAAVSMAVDAPAPLSTVDAAALDLPAPARLEPEDEDFITEHMTEAEVFVKYGLSDRAIEQLLTVIERYPSHVPALSKLKEIYLEEGNREGARHQMAQLVKSYLGAGDGAAAGEALAELKRFDPNCREALELSSIGRGPAAAATPRSGTPAQKAASSDIADFPV